MRLTEILLKQTGRYQLPYGGYMANGRGMTELEFPYVPIRDVKLKNRVSPKNRKEKGKKLIS